GGAGRGRRAESPNRGLFEESTDASRGGRRSEEDFGQERTAVVSGTGRRRRVPRFVETFTNFGRTEVDITGTGALPRRRFSSRAYLVLTIAGVVLIGGIVAAYFLWGGASTGKLSIQTIPSGAQVRLGEQYYGTTPLLVPEIKRGTYRLYLRLEGYEDFATEIEVGSETRLSYPLGRVASLPAGTETPPAPPLLPSPAPLTPPPPGGRLPFEGAFQTALRTRNFFPPASGNAWDVLQRWQQAEGAGPTAALEQARLNLCREVEVSGQEKLEQKDFPAVRSILEQVRRYLQGQGCAAGLQASYDDAVSKTIGTLQGAVRGAMDRHEYVTPEAECALKYVRLILAQDSQNAEAKVLDGEIFTRAWEQAQAKANARLHQEALDIYTQLKRNYTNPPVGTDTLRQATDLQARKVEQFKVLKIPYSIRVKHGHSFGLLPFKSKNCTGILRADGFEISYQGSEPAHSFTVKYDALRSVDPGNGKIAIAATGVPGGKMELEQADKNPTPTLAELYQ
ncbi:MAG: hypothetical protein DMG07_23935, partial [Acidobacteria bacterium]